MLYVDIPTRSEFSALAGARADACVSIYLRTTPVTQDISAARIEFGNLIREAQKQLEDSGFDKRRMAALSEQLSDLVDDDEFWHFQANSLAEEVFRPERIAGGRVSKKQGCIGERNDTDGNHREHQTCASAQERRKRHQGKHL